MIVHPHKHLRPFLLLPQQPSQSAQAPQRCQPASSSLPPLPPPPLPPPRCQIPIAIAADLAFKRSAILDSGRVLGLNILGATLVLAGFFGINAGGWPGVGALLARMGWRRGHLAVPARAED